MTQRRITVSSCNGCPFCHRDRLELNAFYCAIDNNLPTVSKEVRGHTRPESCPLLTNTYRIAPAH
jgi:hypothetical protein